MARILLFPFAFFSRRFCLRALTAEERMGNLTMLREGRREEVSMATLMAKGVNGQVEVDDNFVTITRKGFSAKMTQGFTKGEKRIPISSIVAVQFKKPGALTNGYIQFTLPGGIESKKGIFDSMKDENSVVFRSSHLAEFEAVREAVEAYTTRAAATAPTPSTPAAAPDLTDQLRKLAQLRDDGILTEEEFQAQKQRLLK